MSGVGKGVTTSAIGALLKAKGYQVTAVKIDPYINIDAGTMNPTEHGEVFVLDDGDETDQDMGNYERFLHQSLPSDNYMTTGRVYEEVIRRERNLEYGGKCVEVVPDIPLEVIRRIESAAKKAKAEVTLIEVGGTLGEYQNLIFLEAARMMKLKNPDDIAIAMVGYLPIPSKIGEMKTKPTQHASHLLNGVGLQADIIIGRAEKPLDTKRKEKLSLLCGVPAAHIISAPDVESIYDVPLNFARDKLDEVLVKVLGLPKQPQKNVMQSWHQFATDRQSAKKEITIAIVGKYFSSGEFILSDVYISVIEAIKFSAISLGIRVKVQYVSSQEFEKDPVTLQKLQTYDGVLVPGGFGATGVEGKIKVIQYLREHAIPFFGICYGMQLAVVEYARHVLGWKDAHTAEINSATKHAVIDVMATQKVTLAEGKYGGTMRLGAYPAALKPRTIARTAYGKSKISERHRHRYEVNNKFVPTLEKAGMVFSGTSPDSKLMEIVELPQKAHPFFVACQFHPEFLARPFTAHPLFTSFVAAAIAYENESGR